MLLNYKPLTAAVLCVMSGAALAEETVLEPVVITANRVARSSSETLASTDVITRQDIEQSQAQSVQQLLQGLPGVQFSNSGGPGKSTSLFLRGTNSDHTLILVDGVKIGSATLGTAPLEDIPVEMIDHIEVVRGPRASLYGSEAIGGVIQIFTKRGAQAPYASFGFGSRSTYEGSAGGGFGTATGWVNANASGFSTNGINAIDGSTEPDRDGYTRSNINVSAGKRIGESLSFDVQAQHTEGRNKYDGYTNIADIKQELYAGNLRYTPSERYATSLKLAQNLDSSNNFKEETFSSRFDTRRSQANWQNEVSFAKGQQLVTGFDYQYDKVISDTTYDHDSRYNQAVFAQYLSNIGAFDLQLAGRHDRNEQFGHHNTGSLAAGYTVSPALHLRASYGTAFKAPSFNDLYFPASSFSAGDPNLKPEKSHSSEIGASGKQGNFEWQTSVYRTTLSNAIVWSSDSSDFWQPRNISQAHISGLEINLAQQFGNTRLALSTTWLAPIDESEGNANGKLLALRSRASGKLDLDHKLDKWNFGASFNASGKRYYYPGYPDTSKTIKLGGYTTTDLRAEYAFDKSWKVQTKLENVFSKHYQTAYGYNQPGFGAFVTVRYQAQ